MQLQYGSCGLSIANLSEHKSFPESAPHDTFSTDIATNDTTQISVTFSFDGFPLLKDSRGVVEQFLKHVSDFQIGDTYSVYTSGVLKATKASSRDETVT